MRADRVFFGPISRGLACAMLAACALSAVAPARAADAFTERMRKVRPGMTQREVTSVLGAPQSVLSKYIDVYGRQVEVWRYLPGAPATRPIVPVPAADPPKSRAWQEVKDWKRVQQASYNNPADPLYRSDSIKTSDSRRLPAAQAAFYGAAPPVYQAIFVDGRLQDIRLASTTLS